MSEPLLKILARFDINEEPGLPLDGRAYLSAFNFKNAYHSDLVYAVRTLREVVKNPALEAARQREFKHTIALMWGDSIGDEIIDFLAWQYDTWQENAEISGWQTCNGKVVQSKDGIYLVTCEGGVEILRAEKEFRRVYNNDSIFKTIGPETEKLGIDFDFDFCTSEGRQKLKKIMQQGNYVIDMF